MASSAAGGLATMRNTSNITTPNGVAPLLMTLDCLKNYVLKDFKPVCRG
jgi:hypothetical protein